MDRRTALRIIALGATTPQVQLLKAATHNHVNAHVAWTPGEYKLRFFTEAENQLLDQLMEPIIPADSHSPGARAAKVSLFADLMVATGEEVTAGLLAIVLEGMGVNARSWQGWQLPILTDNAHGAARILDINGAELIRRFEEMSQVAVIAGFQGLHKESGRITTLGRGGSDTSALAVAAAIKADRCDIYTDVDGVYTTDPRVVPKARRLDKIAFEDMLERPDVEAEVVGEPYQHQNLILPVRMAMHESLSVEHLQDGIELEVAAWRQPSPDILIRLQFPPVVERGPDVLRPGAFGKPKTRTSRLLPQSPERLYRRSA